MAPCGFLWCKMSGAYDFRTSALHGFSSKLMTSRIGVSDSHSDLVCAAGGPSFLRHNHIPRSWSVQLPCKWQGLLFHPLWDVCFFSGFIVVSGSRFCYFGPAYSHSLYLLMERCRYGCLSALVGHDLLLMFGWGCRQLWQLQQLLVSFHFLIFS